MTTEKSPPRASNRVREALGKLYDQEPPYFREYLRRFKEDPTSRVFAPLAEAYRRLGRVEEAIAICHEGLKHHPEFHGGRVALAKCYLDKKGYPEARQELSRVVSAAPDNLLAQKLLGEACFALDDKASALHAFKMALLLSPSDVALSERVRELERQAPPVADVEAAPPLPRGLGAVRAPADETDDWTPEPAPGKREETIDGATDEVEPFDLDALLSAEPDDGRRDDDSFRIEHVSAIFSEEASDGREITTSTLGDLYFGQGQFDKALRIFEKIAEKRTSPEVQRKIHLCRVKLGVDEAALVRNKQIETLRTILRKVRAER